MRLENCRPLVNLPLLAGLLLAALVSWAPAFLVEADRAIIASDGFETGSYRGGAGWVTGWNVSSAVSVVTTQEPRSGIRHLEMRGSAVASRTIDLTGWAEVELSFWAQALALDPGDFVYAEVSPNGRAWQLLEVWTGAAADSQHHLYEYDLTAAGQWDTLFIRFLSQMDEPTDYFYVDDVLVQGVAASSSDVVPAAPDPVPTAPMMSNLSAASSSGHIVMDGHFSDWEGYPHLTDPPGDASKARGDLSAFYWFSDLETQVNYFMLERHPASADAEEDDEEEEDEEDHPGGEGAELGNAVVKPVKYTIYIDTNDDGSFDGPEDRQVRVDYHPKADHSDVRVRVQPGRSGQTLYSASGDWGESIAQGGRRVELAVSWDDLGIGQGEVVRMYVESQWDDRLPDSGDIQWSAASVLGYWLLAGCMAAGAAALWQIRKRRDRTCRSGLE